MASLPLTQQKSPPGDHSCVLGPLGHTVFSSSDLAGVRRSWRGQRLRFPEGSPSCGVGGRSWVGAGGKVVRQGSHSACLPPAGEALLLLLPGLVTGPGKLAGWSPGAGLCSLCVAGFGRWTMGVAVGRSCSVGVVLWAARPPLHPAGAACPRPPQPSRVCTHDVVVCGLAFPRGGRASCSFLLRNWDQAGILLCPFVSTSPLGGTRLRLPSAGAPPRGARAWLRRAWVSPVVPAP